MTFFRIGGLCALWLAVAAVAPGAEITIAKGSGRATFDASPFGVADAAGKTFVTVLENNLARSGWLAKGAPGAADFIVTGQAVGRGDQAVIEVRVAARGETRPRWSKTYREPVSGLRRAAHDAADEILRAATGKRGMASARLAMVGTGSGHKEIYLADADGGGLVQLTSHRSISLSPEWSPDGRFVFYTSYFKGFPAVYRVELGNGRLTRIANYAGLNTGGAVSPDGRQVALILSKDGNPELYVMNLADGALARLTRTPNAVEASPTWSPDGRQIAYVSDEMNRQPRVYVINRGGGQGRRVSRTGSQNVAPSWGPDGRIAYATLSGGRFGITVFDPATGQETPVSTGAGDFEDPAWAPNGRHIAATHTVGYRSQVVLLDTMGDPYIVLTDGKGDWSSPNWTKE